MTRTEVINEVIQRTGARSYLEIGVRNPADNFFPVLAAQKIGVDPACDNAMGLGWVIHKTTSGAYAALWRESSNPRPIDVVFIDGDHRAAGVAQDLLDYQDIARLAIVCHDCWPGRGELTTPEKPDNGQPWCGGAWAAWSAWCSKPGPWVRYLCRDDHGLGIAARVATVQAPKCGHPPESLSQWLACWPSWCEQWR